jgi:hypothetical protein
MAHLTIPPQVAGITYPRGCRIRRVRVRDVEQPAAARGGNQKPLIVSRRALKHARTAKRPAER